MKLLDLSTATVLSTGITVGKPCSLGNMTFSYTVLLKDLSAGEMAGYKLLVYWDSGASDWSYQPCAGVLISNDSLVPLTGGRDLGMRTGHPPILRPKREEGALEQVSIDKCVEEHLGTTPEKFIKSNLGYRPEFTEDYLRKQVEEVYSRFRTGDAPYPYLSFWNR